MVWKQSIRKRMLYGFLIVVVCIGVWTVVNRVLNPVALKERDINTKNWIVYVHSETGSDDDIYMMNADGSNMRAIIKDQYRQFDPTWSPSGKRLVYMCETPQQGGSTQQIYPQLYVADPTGSPRKPMTYSQGAKSGPVFDTSGDMVLFTNQGMIISVDLTNGQSEQVLPPIDKKQIWASVMPGGKVQFGKPYYSNATSMLYAVQELDNSQMLVTYTSDSHKTAKTGGTEQSGDEATKAATQEAKTPEPIMAGETIDIAPSFDGSRLAFSVISNDHKQSGILIRELATGENHLLWKGKLSMLPGKLAWSKDGSTIAVEIWQETASGDMLRVGIGIYNVFKMDSSELVMAVKGNVGSPALSPDGNQLAYVVYRNGGRDIWCCNSDGTHQKNLTEGRGDNYDPKWSPQ